MKAIVTIVLITSLATTGCAVAQSSDALDTLVGQVETRAATVADKSLRLGFRLLCVVASQGSLDRYFGDDEKSKQAYDALCRVFKEGEGKHFPLAEEKQ